MFKKKKVITDTVQRHRFWNTVYSLLILLAVLFLFLQFFILRERPEKYAPAEEKQPERKPYERIPAEADLSQLKVRNVSISEELQKETRLNILKKNERLKLIVAEASAGLRGASFVREVGVDKPGGYTRPRFSFGAQKKFALNELALNDTQITCGFTGNENSQIVFGYSNINGVRIPEGFVAAGKPLRPKCNGESLDLTVAIPQNYGEVSVLRCVNNACREAGLINVSVNDIVCAGRSIVEARKIELGSRPTYIAPDEWGVEINSGKFITQNERFLAAGNYLFEFVNHKENFIAKASTPEFNITNPINPEFFFVGVPIILKIINGNVQNVSVQVSVTYPTMKHFDRSMLAFYAKQGDRWKYLGGNISSGFLNLDIADLSEVLDSNNAVILGVMGLMCVSCDVARLEKIYDGSSRDAIVFVHGLFSSPVTWQDLIDDYVMNKQPWQIWTLTYPSNMTTFGIAQQFVENLKLREAEFDNVYIVGHSFGAFVVQAALDVAVAKNAQFSKKIKKIILVGSPNDGTPVLEAYQKFFAQVINSKESVWLFSVKDQVVNALAQGLHIPMVKGIQYYVIAGDKPYNLKLGTVTVSTTDLFNFTEPNDGLTSVSGAQHVGESFVNKKCQNFYKVHATHTDLTSNGETRKIIERIISDDIIAKKQDVPLAGYNKYVRFTVPACISGEKYVVIGKKTLWSAIETPLSCACGNGVCGLDENEDNCPSDCAK